MLAHHLPSRMSIAANILLNLSSRCYNKETPMDINTTITGNLVDIQNKEIYLAEVIFSEGKIIAIHQLEKDVVDPDKGFIMPGFIDAHIHIESSMLVPSVFARAAVVHGTVATVSDPHEIANVMGKEGVDYMIGNGKLVNFKFYFGAPSCVPATSFETAGAVLSTEETEQLLKMEDIKYLAEMMNWPGVLYGDKEVYQKIASAKKWNKPIDGHAPGLLGDQAKKYAEAGISTDHECFTLQEALDKLRYGMKIIIREGSAAKNFEALYSLIDANPDKVMLCSDDKHPDELVEGHINQLVSRAVAKGLNLFNVLRAACINPVEHYSLDVGQLQIGQPADFIIVKDLANFGVLQTYINGELVAEKGASRIAYQKGETINNFDCNPKKPADFKVSSGNKTHIKVIVPHDGQLVTTSKIEEAEIENGFICCNLKKDTLKLTVVNRYKNTPPSVAFIKNFGLKQGAIASCVGHDSHNIIAVGVNDEAIATVVNLIIANKGGLCAYNGDISAILPLPIAGIMSDKDAPEVAAAYTKADKMVKEMGCTLKSPFMTLSFMALLVIPSLKLSDKGLFDGDKFEFCDVVD